MLSLFNLLLNLALIAFAAPADFGRYAYALAVLLVLTSLQNALIATPISVMVAGRTGADREETLAALVRFDRVIRLAAAALAPVLCLPTETAPSFLAAVALAAFASLGRETRRAWMMAGGRERDALTMDFVAVAVSLAAMAAIWPLAAPATAALGGIGLGSLAGLWLAPRPLVPPAAAGTAGAVRGYGRFWPDTRWSLVGAATTEAEYRAYVFALEAFRDSATLGNVQAGRLLLGPLPLAVTAWARVARPAMARMLAAGDRVGMLRLTFLGLAGALAVALAFAAALYIAWPWLERWIFKGRYEDIGRMTAVWTLCTAVIMANGVLSVPLQVEMRFKELARVTMTTVAIATVMLCGLALPVPAIYAVVAATAAEIFALGWVAALVWRGFADGSRTGLEPGPEA